MSSPLCDSLCGIPEPAARCQATEIDIVADNPGMTLFHCYQQLRLDFGFMTLFYL